MKPVQANFVQPKLPSRLAWGLVVLLVTLALMAAAATKYMMQETAVLISTTQAARERLSQPSIAPPQEVPKPYDQSAREFLQNRSRTWPAALENLESVAMAGISISTIEVVPTESRAQVDLQATTQEVLLSYVQAINDKAIQRGEATWHWSIGSTEIFSVGGISARLVVDMKGRLKSEAQHSGETIGR